MDYQMTPLEERIRNLYLQLGITSPSQLNFSFIASRLNVPVHIRDWDSKAIKFKGKYHIVLNQELSSEEKWQDFGHELCHVLRHTGNQLYMPALFRTLQEAQANNFMYHFCVPTFMLLDLDLPTYRNQAIAFISNCFNVTIPFAKERLEQFENRLYGLHFFEQLAESSQTYSTATIETEQEIDLYEDIPPWEQPGFAEFIEQIPTEERDELIWNMKSTYYEIELQRMEEEKHASSCVRQGIDR